ncbi:hypothetical protein GLA29479_4381 [Lysobacter antibioticus]|uniref:hypothetical protein n=1 Tax=Lysobacter antibioticus TaxID=84531 RepID=UPI00071F26DC|nr:hypothetical protein [Lysobacter antibioticus]ALN65219.1 hypothetical protein GLA29479_4381 [Lysobacter antibioticus]
MKSAAARSLRTSRRRQSTPLATTRSGAVETGAARPLPCSSRQRAESRAIDALNAEVPKTSVFLRAGESSRRTGDAVGERRMRSRGRSSRLSENAFHFAALALRRGASAATSADERSSPRVPALPFVGAAKVQAHMLGDVVRRRRSSERVVASACSSLRRGGRRTSLEAKNGSRSFAQFGLCDAKSAPAADRNFFFRIRLRRSPSTASRGDARYRKNSARKNIASPKPAPRLGFSDVERNASRIGRMRARALDERVRHRRRGRRGGRPGKKIGSVVDSMKKRD